MSVRVEGFTAVCALFWSMGALSEDLLPEISTGVQNRPHPEYESLGIDFVGLRITPALAVTAAFDDNIFAAEDQLATSDFLTLVDGSIGVANDSQYIPVSLSGGATYRSYAEYSAQDSLDAHGNGTAVYNIGVRTSVKLSGEFIRSHQSRNDPSFPTGAVQAPALDSSGIGLEFSHAYLRGRLDFSGDYRSFSYHNAESPQGQVLDQSFRDRSALTLQARLGYSVLRNAAAFMKFVRVGQMYDAGEQAELDRSSTSNAIYVGSALQITNLMDGEIGIGVLSVDNQDGQQRDSTTLAISSQLNFYATQLITIELAADRFSGTADLASSASYIETKGSLGLYYEIRRNVLLSTKYAASQREYVGHTARDRTQVLGVQASWLLNRRLKAIFDASHSHFTFPVSFSGRDYTDTSVFAKVTLSF